MGFVNLVDKALTKGFRALDNRNKRQTYAEAQEIRERKSERRAEEARQDAIKEEIVRTAELEKANEEAARRRDEIRRQNEASRFIKKDERMERNYQILNKYRR